MSGRPLSPPSRRRRKKVGFVDDSEESWWQPPQPSVDRGLETVRVAAAARARGTSKLGAASLGPGRSTASGTSSSYEMVEMVEGSPSPALSSPEPDRCHQQGADVHVDAGRDGEGHERGWTWTADQDWRSYSERDHAWHSWHEWYPDPWSATSWSSWRWSSSPWTTWSWSTWHEEPRPAHHVPSVAHEEQHHNVHPSDGVTGQAELQAETLGDQVADWWQSDGKLNEPMDAAECPAGPWEHFRMNGNSDEEGLEDKTGANAPSNAPSKAKPRIPSSYPSSFAALPTESYKEWKRAVQMWIAGEGGMLPSEVIGPRVLSVLKGRASILTRKLSVDEVSKPEGLALIFSTLESSSLVQELSGQRGERAQREFLQCRRAAHESLDSFLMRVEAQRDLMLEEDAEFAMGERFLVGYVLDNSELTQRDRVLVMAAAGNRLSTSAVYPALRRMGPFLQGTVPIGRGLSDRPLLPELQPDVTQGGSTQASTGHGRGRFGRSYGTHVLDEAGVGSEDIAAEEGDEEPPATGDDEISAAEHEAFLAAQQGQARLKAIRQARGYYRRTEQSAGGDNAAKKRLEELMAKNPCRACGGYGHWSRDAVCPKNQARASAGANVMTSERVTPPAVTASEALTASASSASKGASTQAAKGTPAIHSHAALTAVLESYIGRKEPAQHAARAYMVAAAEGGFGFGDNAETVFDLSSDTFLAHPPKSTDYEGVMILDIGCVRSVAGTAWVEREIAIRQRLGKHVSVERASDWFRFGDGVRRLSSYRVFLEIAIKGHTGLLAVNVIDYPCPPLLSKAVCNLLGMCIDCESNACEIRRLGERRCALCVSPEGHYLVRINDFFPKNPSWHTLVFEQNKQPKVNCDEVRMFEIRQGTAVGKGSKSRLRRQALAAV